MIHRPRLYQRLIDDDGALITLLSAPAGFGKTTLLSAWLNGRWRPAHYAWLSLAATDNEPRRLWADLLAAIRSAGPSPPGDVLAQLRPPPTGSHDEFVELLADTLDRRTDPLVCVIDDAHELRNLAVFEELGQLLRHPPRHVRFVIATRVDPALPMLARERADGRLSELRADELAFTREETAVLLGALGRELEPRLAEQLWERTEGWPAGIRLAGLSLAKADDPAAFVGRFAGDDRSVADYLLSEVLGQQDLDTRAFLLRTSIADRLSAGLADAITAGRDGARRLAALARENVFLIALDSHATHYRYHGLFVDLLRNELRIEAPDELPELHRRAAAWYARAGHPLSALGHAIAGADWQLAAELLTASWPTLLIEGRAADVHALLAGLPADVLQEHPALALVAAADRLELDDVVGADAYLALADADGRASERTAPHQAVRRSVLVRRARITGDLSALADDDHDEDGAAVSGGDGGAHPAAAVGDRRREDADRRLLGLRDRGYVALLRDRPDEAERHLRGALELARRRGRDYVAVRSLSLLAVLELARCRPGAALAGAEAALGLAEPAGWAVQPLVAWAHVATAGAELARGSPEAAREASLRATDCAQRSTEHAIHLATLSFDAITRAALGDREELARALTTVRTARDLLGDAPRTPIARVDLGAVELRLLVMLGASDAARAVLTRLLAEPRVPRTRRLAAGARLELVMDAPDRAVALLETALDEPSDDAFAEVEVWALRAAVAIAQRDERTALTAIERALDGAEPEGYRAALPASEPLIREALELAVRRGTGHRAFVADLLTDRRDRAASPLRELLEPLSEREETVLRFLPTELSNAEIASEMYVSVNTVKTHLRSIYRKLDVTRRREAVDRARALSLLGPRAGARRHLSHR